MDPYDYPVILRVLVGSQSHGTARPDSDHDFKEVFIIPTRELLQVPVSSRPKTAWSSESRHTDDEAGWEIAQTLEMVMRGHPNAVEVMFAPIVEANDVGRSLIELRPRVLASGTFLASTLGYAQNCRNKLISKNQMDREVKWKATYLRVLFAGKQFLETGIMPINVNEQPWGGIVLRALRNEMTTGEVIDYGLSLEEDMRQLKGIVVPERADVKAVNDWLAEVRRSTLMVEHADPRMIDDGMTNMLNLIKDGETELKSQESRLERLWKNFNKELDRVYGAGRPALVIEYLGKGQYLKAGRYLQHRGGGLDTNMLAGKLRDKLTLQEWSRLFSEQQTTVIHANIPAIEAMSALNPAVAAAIEECTTKGIPTVYRIKPEWASQMEVSQALAAQNEQQDEAIA